MDNFKTIAAVLVVLAAFTGFQFIANYSLRNAVRADVQRQISQTDDQASKHNEQLKQAYELSGSLAQSLADSQAHLQRINEEFEATTGRFGQVSAKAATAAETVDALDEQIKSLAGQLDSLATQMKALEQKMNELKQSADAGKRAEVNLAAISSKVNQFEEQVSSASQNASLALSTAQQIKNNMPQSDAVEMDQLKRNVADMRFMVDQMSADIRNLQNDRN